MHTACLPSALYCIRRLCISCTSCKISIINDNNNNNDLTHVLLIPV